MTPLGEFLCVLRDVSATGLKVRLFHPLPPKAVELSLELGSGQCYPLERVWETPDHAGFRFAAGPVALSGLIDDAGDYPRRHVRLKVDIPAWLVLAGTNRAAILRDISQHGALLLTEPTLPVGARVEVRAPGVLSLAGCVRWRRRSAHGVVFSRGFRLDELARLVEALQRAQPAPANEPVSALKQAVGAAAFTVP